MINDRCLRFVYGPVAMMDQACSACDESLNGGQFCRACGAAAGELSPFATPREVNGPPILSPAASTLHDVAKYQRFIIWILLGSMIGVGASTIIAALIGPEFLARVAIGISVMSWGLAVLRVILVYRLAVAAQVSVGWAIFAAICGIHSLVGLVALLIVNAKATKLLKQAGLRVGFLGVSTSTLEELSAPNP
jgi:hypothetical protein